MGKPNCIFIYFHPLIKGEYYMEIVRCDQIVIYEYEFNRKAWIEQQGTEALFVADLLNSAFPDTREVLIHME